MPLNISPSTSSLVASHDMFAELGRGVCQLHLVCQVANGAPAGWPVDLALRELNQQGFPLRRKSGGPGHIK